MQAEAVDTSFFNNCENHVRQRVMTWANKFLFWNSVLAVSLVSFIEMLHVFSDKIATSLKAEIVVNYPGQVGFLNVHDNFVGFFIARDYKIAGFLPFSTEVKIPYESRA